MNDGSNGIAIGTNALGAGDVSGAHNIAMGYRSGYDLNTGAHNVFLGYQSGYDANSGACNVAIGSSSFSAATSACDNIAIGQSALGGAIVTGANNIGIGLQASDAITSGYNNVAIGKGALGATASGQNIVAIGTMAGGCCPMTTEHNSVSIGTCAGRNMCGTSVNNTNIGHLAGGALTSGSQNTFIGKYSGCNSDFEATTHANVIQLGDANTLCFIVACALHVPSDCRDKTDVSDLDLGLDYIKALRPVYYRWDKRGYYFENGINNDEDRNLFINYKSDGSKKKPKWEVGLLAQEALAAEKEYTSKRQVLDPEFGIPDADEGILVGGTYKTSYNCLLYTSPSPRD